MNHATKTRRLLEQSRKIEEIKTHFPSNEEKRQRLLAEAQIHALLEVAEQQRVSNLIALARVESENNSTPTDALNAIYDREETTYDVKLRTRSEILSSLRIGKSS